jgi:hypothetical protein
MYIEVNHPQLPFFPHFWYHRDSNKLKHQAERTKPPAGAEIQPEGLGSFSAGSLAPRTEAEELMLCWKS